jgi:opacity protein-like surface antigen
MAVSALMMAAALVAGDPDGVVATAPATTVDLTAVTRPVAPSAEHAAQQAAEPHNLTTDQQIDRWLESRDPAATPYSGQRAERPVDDRKMHGEFTAGIGTGGYTDYGMAVSLPIGENGRLALSYRQTQNGLYGYGYRFGDYGLGGNPYYNDMGYSFSGRPDPNKALDYEYRLARPDGAPNARWSPYRGPRIED